MFIDVIAIISHSFIKICQVWDNFKNIICLYCTERSASQKFLINITSNKCFCHKLTHSLSTFKKVVKQRKISFHCNLQSVIAYVHLRPILKNIMNYQYNNFCQTNTIVNKITSKTNCHQPNTMVNKLKLCNSKVEMYFIRLSEYFFPYTFQKV